MLFKVFVLVVEYFKRKCILILSFLYWLLRILNRMFFELSNFGIYVVFNDFNL